MHTCYVNSYLVYIPTVMIAISNTRFTYMFCKSLYAILSFFLLAIVLYVLLWLRDSSYPFSIFKPFLLICLVLSVVVCVCVLIYYSKRLYTYLLCKQLLSLYSHSIDRDLQYTVHHIMCLIFYCQELLHSCNCMRHHSVKSNEKLNMLKKELNRKTIESNKLKHTSPI
jgi:glucan phosphoethanolaminetransferase (alkaline phosphatase superfamily)